MMQAFAAPAVACLLVGCGLRIDASAVVSPTPATWQRLPSAGGNLLRARSLNEPTISCAAVRT